MDKIKVGKFLKSLREQKGKKQFQVAMDLEEYKIKVSDKSVAKWEKGNFPDIDKIGAIAEYYGVKASDILNGEIYFPQNFEKRYFIVNNEWMHNCLPDELYNTRVEQERLIKSRVKELFIELIEKTSLTAMQNDELNFLLDKFYSVSDYAINKNSELGNEEGNQVKLLRLVIYRDILSMRDSTANEIYWEIKKFINYNRRATFSKDVQGYETDVTMAETVFNNLEDWEKDLLLAQFQTKNIECCYDKLSYLHEHGIEYDEEQITKEGIKLLIKCGAKLNQLLLGYTLHRNEPYSIIDRMETLQARLKAKRLMSQYDGVNGRIELFWAENSQKSRLIDLYYMINGSRETDGKLSLEEIYQLFMDNDEFPKILLLDRYKKYIKADMSSKEQELFAERMGIGEISTWREYKEREKEIEAKRCELSELEERWNAGQRIGIEYDEWVGEKDNELTENDILSRLAQMTYAQYVESRDIKLTENLLAEIDMLSLDEIRKKYFSVEGKHEKI